MLEDFPLAIDTDMNLQGVYAHHSLSATVFNVLG